MKLPTHKSNSYRKRLKDTFLSFIAVDTGIPSLFCQSTLPKNVLPGSVEWRAYKNYTYENICRYATDWAVALYRISPGKRTYEISIAYVHVKGTSKPMDVIAASEGLLSYEPGSHADGTTWIYVAVPEADCFHDRAHLTVPFLKELTLLV